MGRGRGEKKRKNNKKPSVIYKVFKVKSRYNRCREVNKTLAQGKKVQKELSMRASIIKAHVASMREQSTQRLKAKISDLTAIIDERALTRSMYKWGPNGGNTRTREWIEKKLARDCIVVVNGCLSIHYERSVSMSGARTYGKDRIEDQDGNSITVGDLKKLIAGIEELLAERGEA